MKIHRTERNAPPRVSDSLQKAVFLDRDGVINSAIPDGNGMRPPLSLGELKLEDAVIGALGSLTSMGFLLLSVTNQPDIARGSISFGEVDRINTAILTELPLSAIYYCPHDGPDRCDCRKPRSGLIVAAAEEWAIDLTKSYLIGDRWVDIASAKNAGLIAILLERSYSWEATSSGSPPSGLEPDFRASNLEECVHFILKSHDAKSDEWV